MGSIVLVSTCGTSCLTYGLEPEDRAFLTRCANARSLSDLPQEDRARLEEIVIRQQDALERSSAEEARRRSAEINGILSYVGDPNEVDRHLLVHSDTEVGRHAADGVRRWLEATGAAVELKEVAGLQVEDQRRLDEALAECARWVFDDLKWLRDVPGKRLVFHTTGGFKAVQGFFQTLGLLRADETVYLFEGTSQVVRIPRLPLTVDLGQLSESQLLELRRLLRELEPTGIELPETLAAEGRLTAYGHLVAREWWDRAAADRLLPPISQRLRYGTEFPKTVAAEESRRLPTINRRLEELALWIETGKGLKGVDPKAIRGAKVGQSDYEADAWHDGGAKRFFLHREEGVWVVDRLGEALH